MVSDLEKTVTALMDLPSNCYRVRFGNLQRNSFVAQTAPSSLHLRRRIPFTSFDSQLMTMPRSTMVSDILVAVEGQEELMLFDLDAQPLKLRTTSSDGASILAAGGYGFVAPSHQLSFAERDHELLIDRHRFPMLQDRTRAMLWCPHLDGFIAVVQDLGRLFKPDEKPIVYAYYTKLLSSGWEWLVELPGYARQALLSTDRRQLVIVGVDEISIFEVDSGASIAETTALPLEILQASLTLQNELLLLVEERENEARGTFLQQRTLSGELMWSYPLNRPLAIQPPVCNESGDCFVVESGELLCVRAGVLRWRVPLPPSSSWWLTALAGDVIVAVANYVLLTFDGAGKARGRASFQQSDEQLRTLAAVGQDGCIYISSDRALYQYE